MVEYQITIDRPRGGHQSTFSALQYVDIIVTTLISIEPRTSVYNMHQFRHKLQHLWAL